MMITMMLLMIHDDAQHHHNHDYDADAGNEDDDDDADEDDKDGGNLDGLREETG